MQRRHHQSRRGQIARSPHWPQPQTRLGLVPFARTDADGHEAEEERRRRTHTSCMPLTRSHRCSIFLPLRVDAGASRKKAVRGGRPSRRLGGTFEIAGVQFVIRAREDCCIKQRRRTPPCGAVLLLGSCVAAAARRALGNAHHMIPATQEFVVLMRCRLKRQVVAKSLAMPGMARRARVRFWPEKRKEGDQDKWVRRSQETRRISRSLLQMSHQRGGVRGPALSCASDSEARWAGWMWMGEEADADGETGRSCSPACGLLSLLRERFPRVPCA